MRFHPAFPLLSSKMCGCERIWQKINMWIISLHQCSVQIASHGSPFYEMSALLLHNWISIFYHFSVPCPAFSQLDLCFVLLPSLRRRPPSGSQATPHMLVWAGLRPQMSSVDLRPPPGRGRVCPLSLWIDSNTASTDWCVCTERANKWSSGAG